MFAFFIQFEVRPTQFVGGLTVDVSKSEKSQG